MYKRLVKPVLDFCTAGILVLLTFPITIIISLFLYFQNNGKIFFRQIRPGKDEKPFQLLKFRTMNDKKDREGNLLPDDQRLTRLGKFIRKTSLDELPQLINVLRGEISLIGPRPLLMEYLPLYNSRQKRRHEVKPGITGWAQVNGRNQLPWEHRFEHDIFYVDHLSFMFDMKILFMTIYNVLIAKGVTSKTSVTMEKFTGSKEENSQLNT